MMKTRVALVGANGNVGRELCLLFRNDPDIEIVPIVRNMLGASFLSYHGIDCRIVDLQDEDELRRQTADVAAVVVATHIHSGGYEALRESNRIVTDVVRCSPSGCKVIYFSSIRVFGSKVDQGTPRFGFPSQYDVRKRAGERALAKACRRKAKPGYVLRLGHVFGPLQPRTLNLIESSSTPGPLRLQVAPDRPSNIVQTVVIQEAVRKCILGGVPPGSYSVVNEPQWTWKDVFEYYKGETTTLVWQGRERGRAKNWGMERMLRFLGRLIVSNRRYLEGMRSFLPPFIELRVRKLYWVWRFRQFSGSSSQAPPVSMREFRYRPMPGRTIPIEAKTRELMHRYASLVDLGEHERMRRDPSPGITSKARLGLGMRVV